MQTTSTATIGAGAQRPPTPLRRAFWRIHLGLAVIFMAAVLVQVFLAGAGIFSGGRWLVWHEALGHALVMVALALLIIGLISRLPAAVNWLSALLFVLVALQPIAIYAPRMAGVPFLSALHTVNALMLFVLPLAVIVRVRRSLNSARSSLQS